MKDARIRCEVATVKRAPVALLLVAFAAVVFLLLAAMLPRFALAQTTPVLDAIAPAQADPGTQVTLTGSGFGPTEGKKSDVEFAWHRAADIVSWSDTEIVVIVPARAEDGYVHVTVDGADSNEIWFVASSPPLQPRLDSLSTYMGPPGTEVTFSGANFGPKKTSSYVVFAGERGVVKSWSDTEIVATVPKDAVPGWAGVVADGVSSNGLYFMPFAQPVVTALDETEGLPGDTVTITGSDFGKKQETGWVTFAGTPGQVSSWSDTRIVVTVPEGAAAGYVGVVQNGVASNGVFFVPFDRPAIEGLSDNYAFVGTTVVVAGRNFMDTPGTLTIGGAPVAPDSWSDTEIVFTIPDSGPRGYVGVARDGATSNGVWMTAVPRVDSISSSSASEGDQIAITGVGFGDGSDGDAILNGEPIPVVSWSETEVIATVPAAASSGYVGIVRAWATSNGKHLTVAVRAHVDSVDAEWVSVGQELTITGSDFGLQDPNSYVAISGAHVLEVVSWSDTVIVARVPAGAETGYLGVIKQGVASNGVWLGVLQ